MSFRTLAGALAFAAASCAAVAAAQAAPPPKSIPALKEWWPHAGAFRFGRRTEVAVDARSASLLSTARFFARELSTLSGYRVTVAPAGESTRAGDIVLRLDRSITLGRESYVLDVGRTLVVRSPSADGVFWGTQTLLQWRKQTPTIAAGTAEDWPDYPSRSVNLCNCSKYYTIAWTEQLIRDMAYLKYNVLHVQMALPDERYPAINRAWPIYTKADALELIRFARQYHVTVMPGTDMPGHMNRFLRARPQLALHGADGADAAKVSRSDVDLGNPAAYSFMTGFADRLMADYPSTTLWHAGADEYLATPKAYYDYPSLVAWARAHAGPQAKPWDVIPLWGNWMDGIVKAHGKQMIMWNDSLLQGAVTRLNPDIVIAYWYNFAHRMTVRQFADNGNALINAGVALYYVVGGGHPNPRKLYTGFAPNVFVGGQRLEPRDPHVLGAMFSIWPDGLKAESEEHVAHGIYDDLRVVAQENWGGPKPEPAYDAFAQLADTLGHAPGYLAKSAVPLNRTYRIRNLATGRYATFSGSDDRWRVERDADGEYTLVSAATGTCATVAENSWVPGAAIVRGSCTDIAGAQHFTLERHGRAFVIRSSSSGLIVGANQTQQRPTEAAPQRWVFVD